MTPPQTQQKLPPPVDVDHRGILPPPPPPPVLPILGHMEDVDHRLLPTLPPPVPVPTPPRHHQPAQHDVDHRNLISLTHQPPIRPPNPVPRPVVPVINLDQDYRVPPMVTPSDIVESVDMDLSEDEEQQGGYPNQELSLPRRHSFNNNKVLVGGDNGKTNHKENTNLIQINSGSEFDNKAQSAPILPPLSNPFENMPSGLKNFNLPFQDLLNEPIVIEENSNDSAYEEDLRTRGMEKEVRNPSPPMFEDYRENEWQNPAPRPFLNQRFPRNWGPRTNFRPQGFGPQWPRNGPRPPNRWAGPRPQRFW